MKALRNNRLSFIICCALVALITFGYRASPSSYAQVIELSLKISAPIEELLSKAIYAISSFSDNIGSFFTGFEENKRLKQRNLALEQYYYFYKQLEQENQQLHQELHFVKNIEYKYISTKIIARSNNAINQQITINAGKSQGIKKWQIILFHNQLIGRVIEVHDETSIAALITDPASRIPVIATESQSRFIAAGNLLDYLDCKYLSKQAELKPSELVVTSGDELDIIPGIIVGIVLKEQNNFYVKSTIDFSKLSFVHVIMP